MTTFPGCAGLPKRLPPDWTTRLECERTNADGTATYRADIYRRAEWVCRVAMAGAFATQAKAEQALIARVNG